MNTNVAPVRVIVYIDGYNLYYGLRSDGLRRFYWLDINLLAKNICLPGEELVHVRYFTTRISSPLDRMKRQSTYIDAIATLCDTTIRFGRFQRNSSKCGSCGVSTTTPSEKKTDVNIAVDLLCDAHQNKFDKAYLISGDADLVAPLEAVKMFYPEKKITIAFPPNRDAKELRKKADAFIYLTRANFASSQFPDQITTESGFILQRPNSWK